MKGYCTPSIFFDRDSSASPTKRQMERSLNWIKRYAPGGYVRFDTAQDEIFATGDYAWQDHEWFFKQVKKRGLKLWFVFNENIPNRTKWRELEGIEWKPDTPFLYPWWNIPQVYWNALDNNVQAVLDLANTVFKGLEGSLVEDGNERCNTYGDDQIPFLPYGEMPNNFLERQLTRWNHSDKMNLHGAKWIGSSMEGGHAFDREFKSSLPLINAAGCLNYHSYGTYSIPGYQFAKYVGEVAHIGVPERKRSSDLRTLVAFYDAHEIEAVCGYAAMSLTNPEYSVLTP